MAMFTISTPLTLFVFGMIIFMALFIGRIGKSLKKESKEGKEVLGKLTSIIDESISGIKIIQAYFVQDWIKNKFATENKNYYDVFNKMYRKRDLSSPLTEFLAIIVVCIVLWFGGQLVLAGGNLNPSNFIAFMVIFSQLIPPAKSFSSAFYEIKKGMASFERIQEILDAPDSDDSLRQRTQTLPSFQNNIAFKNISFQYPNSQSFAINDFTFTFEKGKKYALVGASGAGKSTLFDLILQFIAPQKGQIEIDGKAIETMDLKNYRNFFGIVSQEAILFNYSVAENIAFEALEKQQISNALQISNAKEFVEKMNPETYYAIGERGSKLSGGEKQRLSISRVAYRNPEIILLDEATSALDSKNEQEVQSALKNLLADKTSIIIAHRLSTIKEVDCILVMQEGSIVEVGSHNELIAQNGTYAEMVSLQNLK
jgi:subfamily B ATP-binding cassette protein MsbA